MKSRTETKMKACSLALFALLLVGCATPPVHFTSEAFTVEVPAGWNQPVISENSAGTRISMRKELSKTAYVQVQCDRLVSSGRPSIERLVSELEDTVGLKGPSESRPVAEVLEMKGSGVQNSAVARHDDGKRFHYLIFLPNEDGRLANCVLTVISTGIRSETDADRVMGSLRLSTKSLEGVKRPDSPER